MRCYPPLLIVVTDMHIEISKYPPFIISCINIKIKNRDKEGVHSLLYFGERSKNKLQTIFPTAINIYKEFVLTDVFNLLLISL